MEAQIPEWLDLLQAIVGALVFPIGALIWMLVFIIAYLHPMRTMQREALVLGRESTKVLEKLDREVTPLIKKADATLGKVNELVERFEKRDLNKIEEAIQKLPDAIQKVEGHMKAIRERIERDTAKLPTRKRPELEEEAEVAQAVDNDGHV